MNLDEEMDHIAKLLTLLRIYTLYRDAPCNPMRDLCHSLLAFVSLQNRSLPTTFHNFTSLVLRLVTIKSRYSNQPF